MPTSWKSAAQQQQMRGALMSMRAGHIAEHFLGSDGRVGVELVDHGNARREVEREDLFLGQAVEHHDKRTQRVAMGSDQHLFAAQDPGQDFRQVVRPDAGTGVAQAFAARRRYVVGATPDVDLLLTPLGAGVILVEAGKITVIARSAPDP